MNRKVLIVDDEKPLVDILKYNLKREGYDILTAFDGHQALDMALAERPDIILLDVMLPKMDGFEVCRRIRESMSVPILLLTARAEEVDKVLGLELGADDYITKPFSVRELIARIKANLRRTESKPAANGNGLIKIGDLVIDTDRYEVRKGSNTIELTAREFELLRFLASQQGKIFSREELMEKVWGYNEYYGDLRTVDVTISRLRKKIEDSQCGDEYIASKRGIGYYFKAPSRK